jgi:hypothetical protein
MTARSVWPPITEAAVWEELADSQEIPQPSREARPDPRQPRPGPIARPQQRQEPRREERAARVTVRAAAVPSLGTLLSTKQGLRHAMKLREILGPPVSLREEDENPLNR